MTETKATVVFLDSARNGPVVRVFQCQKSWDDLQPSGDEGVRFCDQCQQAVHQVVDADGSQRAVAQGQCVMVAGYADTESTGKMFVGRADAKSYEVDTAKPKTDAG